MSRPFFSIITICFNAGESLRRTIESVNEQTFPGLEHVIVDGGSTDGSVSLIQSLARRNVRWVSEPDHGIADAFNKGTALAAGEYVCYLNAGDIFAGPEVVALVAARITQGPPAASAVYYGNFFSSRGELRFLHQASAQPEDFAWNNPINHQSAFISRALALRHPYDQRLRLGMDYDLWLRVQSEAQFHKLDFPVAVFASDGRSSDPAWAIHNLMVRRVLWHVNRGSRLEAKDLVRLGWLTFKLKLRFLSHRLMGKKILGSVRQWRAKHRQLDPSASAKPLTPVCEIRSETIG